MTMTMTMTMTAATSSTASSTFSSSFSIQDYCAQQQELLLKQQEHEQEVALPQSSKAFLQALQLPSLHPFCTQFADKDHNNNEDYYPPDIPRQGPWQGTESITATLVTQFYHIVPSLAAMAELWLRLLASVIAPCGIVWMMYQIYLYLYSTSTTTTRQQQSEYQSSQSSQSSRSSQPSLSCYRNTTIALLTTAASVVLLTDTLYVMEFGPTLGLCYFVLASVCSVLLAMEPSSVVIATGATTRKISNKALEIYGNNTITTKTVSSSSSSTASTTITTPSPSSTPSSRRARRILQCGLMCLWILTDRLVVLRRNHSHSMQYQLGNANDKVTNIDEGLYYNRDNAHIQTIVQHWNNNHNNNRKHNNNNQKPNPSNDNHDTAYHYDEYTRWMPTGDARTGLPFLLNPLLAPLPAPTFYRKWLTVEADDHKDASNTMSEVIALDVALPVTGGFDPTKPVYMVLHGLNGGSQEEYVQELASRVTSAPHNATVVVMVARGLMDTPIRGWPMFHGARWKDAHATAQTIRHAVGPTTTLVAVGYSMGAIILNNWLVTAGHHARNLVDGAVSLSGGLDMRPQAHATRAQRLWQPMLTQTLRAEFLMKKWGQRVYERLESHIWKDLLRATHITQVDESAVVHYHGFDNVTDYYQHMSALGDVPRDILQSTSPVSISPQYQIHQLSVPLLVVHALDDPLITWHTVAANHGPMHPHNLVTQTGQGNLMILLTKRGGHVGWPLGTFPASRGWEWMNGIASGFASGIHAVKQEQLLQLHKQELEE